MLDINRILTYQEKRYILYFNIIMPMLDNNNDNNDNNDSENNERIIIAILRSNNEDDIKKIINNNPSIPPQQIRYILNSIIRDLESIYFLTYNNLIYVFIHGVLLANETHPITFDTQNYTISQYIQDKKSIYERYLEKLNTEYDSSLKDIFGPPNIRSYNDDENIFELFASSYKIVNSNITYSREIGLGYNHPNNTLFYLLELNIMNRYILRGCDNTNSIIGNMTSRYNTIDNLYESNKNSYIDMITTQYSIYNPTDNTRYASRSNNPITNTGTDNTTSFKIPSENEIEKLSSSILLMLDNILNEVYSQYDKKYILKNEKVLPYTQKIIIYSNILMSNNISTSNTTSVKRSPEEWLSIDPLNTLLLRVINILITDVSYEFDLNLNKDIVETIRVVINNNKNNNTYDYNKYNMYFPSYLDVRQHQMPQFHKWYKLYISYNIFNLILVNKEVLLKLGEYGRIENIGLQQLFRGRQRRLTHYYQSHNDNHSPSIDQIGYSYELLLCNKYINLIKESEY